MNQLCREGRGEKRAVERAEKCSVDFGLRGRGRDQVPEPDGQSRWSEPLPSWL